MIGIEGLTKLYGQHRAVDNVSFDVGRGEVLGLLGPNGAGKTTIMRMLTGYIPPTSGRVLIDGLDMYDHPDEVKRKLGYLPEHPPLYLDMTVGEYLNFAARIKGVEPRRVRQGVQAAAELCGIADKLGRLTGNLSKGYRQRVGLAQALVHEPEILVLDEPTVGLDPRQIIEIRELIKGLGGERTVILSSHILQEVTSVCRSVAIMNEGTLVAFDTIQRLSASYAVGGNIRMMVAAPASLDLGALRAVRGVESVALADDGLVRLSVSAGQDLRAELSSMVAAMGAGLLEMRSDTLTLEDIFLRAVTGQEAG